ncbi:hypothetical protein F4806DRAFT_499215 [Annulohypoxylon nitens]|nr:hypothetical protein F4806DRAFT_499215 [Annulohypoxylon nitens]
MTSSLSAQARARRADFVEKAYDLVKSKLSKAVVAKLVEDCADHWARSTARLAPSLPTLSADYFNWHVEKSAWGFLVRKAGMANPPPYPFLREEPKMYGSPYSEIYISHLAKVTEQAEVAAEVRKMEMNQDVRASAIEALRKMPPADRDEGVMAKLWREISPNTTYEEGCNQPFVIRLTSFDDKLEVNVGSCLGGDADEVVTNLARASTKLCHEVRLALVENEGHLFLVVSLRKDVDLAEPAFKRRLEQAWLDLLAVNLEWLHLRPINIVEAVDEIKRNPVRSSFVRLMTDQARARTNLDRNIQAYLLRKRELSPEHPERAIRLLNFQLAYVRRAARKAVNLLAVTNGDIGDLLQRLAQIVGGEEYGCLAKYELMKLVQPAAFVLAQRHIRQMALDYNQDRNEANLAARVSEFVLSKVWDNVLSRANRIEICDLGLQGSNSELVMKMKESLSKVTEADEEEGGCEPDPLSQLELERVSRDEIPENMLRTDGRERRRVPDIPMRVHLSPRAEHAERIRRGTTGTDLADPFDVSHIFGY